MSMDYESTPVRHMDLLGLQLEYIPYVFALKQLALL